MNNRPLISIITVVYNGEKHLQQTIDSVVNQTYKNIEYIIIDGASTDGTVEIIKANEKHIDHWVSESDRGLYDAMNKGIDIATGELIGMINSDDWYQLDAIETVVYEYLQNPSKKIFHADRYDIYPDETKNIFLFNHSTFKFKYFAMTYNHPSMFVSPEVYRKYKYNTELNVYSDYQFTLTSYLRDESQFLYINKAIVNFRLGGVSGQAPLLKILKEGYLARKNAGMNTAQCIFGIVCKIGLEIMKLILGKRKMF